MSDRKMDIKSLIKYFADMYAETDFVYYDAENLQLRVMVGMIPKKFMKRCLLKLKILFVLKFKVS